MADHYEPCIPRGNERAEAIAREPACDAEWHAELIRVRHENCSGEEGVFIEYQWRRLLSYY